MADHKRNREILFFEQVEKHLIWGSELWKICAHPHGDCTVRTGNYAGMYLSQLWSKHPELFGGSGEGEFPLLVKILITQGELSIQVHPDDAYARKHENQPIGKTECWYILEGAADAKLVIGHHAKNRKEFDEMTAAGRWRQLLREIPVRKGDFIQLEPGTLHTIKGRVKLLEIQQNSDITYRIYDYDRLSNGKPRTLHLKQGLEMITIPALPLEEAVLPGARRPVNAGRPLISCPYYTVWERVMDQKGVIPRNDSFLIVYIAEGSGCIDGCPIQEGDCFILSAGYGEAEVTGNISLVYAST